MVIADDIFTVLWNAKTYSLELMSRISEKQENGEDVECLENKLIVAVNWIRILEDYYTELDSDGNIPDDPYFTYDQISALMSKMKAMIDLKLPDTTLSSIQTATWADVIGIWEDTAVWDDNINFS